MNLLTGVGLGGAGAGALIAWFVCGAFYGEQIAGLERDWAMERATLALAKTDAVEAARDAEQRSVAAVQELNDAYAQRLADINRRYSDAEQRLRKAHQAGCRANAVPRSTATSSRRDDAANGDGLRAGIGERLARRVARPADEQTARLVACQAYVRDVVLRDVVTQ